MEATEAAMTPHGAGSGADGPGYVAFGLDLFRRLADAQPDANLVVSPLSAGLALSLLANGTTGSTLDGILRALAEGMDLGALNAANAALLDRLRSADVEISVASSLWMRGAPFLPAYVAESRRIYGAEAAALDSAGPVNAWVSRRTGGRITEMLRDPIDPLAILLLLNAVYFKGSWQDEFYVENTRYRTFRAPSGAVECLMMEGTATYAYLRTDGFAAVRLPYRGERFALYVLLPDEGRTLGQLRDALSPDAWRGWMLGFRAQRVRVVLPRFRVSGASVLNGPLGEMGMADAFESGRAALDGMLPAAYVAREQPYVAAVLQKVFVEVDEKGTEAAAATMVFAGGGAAPPRPVELVADRPFVLAIRDDATGALLFVGQVNDPGTE